MIRTTVRLGGDGGDRDRGAVNDVDSWQTGININLEGRQTRMTLMYAGGQPSFKHRAE